MSYPADLRCPGCGHRLASMVRDSRGVVDGRKIRRRRHCLRCATRYRTAERIDDPAVLTEEDALALVADATRLLTLVRARQTTLHAGSCVVGDTRAH